MTAKKDASRTANRGIPYKHRGVTPTQTIQIAPPEMLDELESWIWSTAIAPMGVAGIIFQCDLIAAIMYCRVAARTLEGSKEERLVDSLARNLGLNPASRLNFKPVEPEKPTLEALIA